MKKCKKRNNLVSLVEIALDNQNYDFSDVNRNYTILLQFWSHVETKPLNSSQKDAAVRKVERAQAAPSSHSQSQTGSICELQIKWILFFFIFTNPIHMSKLPL